MLAKGLNIMGALALLGCQPLGGPFPIVNQDQGAFDGPKIEALIQEQERHVASVVSEQAKNREIQGFRKPSRLFPRLGKTWIAAHKGACRFAPENTMPAFELAEKIGTQYFEFDVLRSRDGELVVIHDEFLTRTTNGRGFVRHRNYYGDMEFLDAGSWFSPRFEGERLPTLGQVLEWARDKDIIPIIEFKQYGIARQVKEELVRTRMARRAVCFGYFLKELDELKRYSPETATVPQFWSRNLSSAWAIRYLSAGRHTALSQPSFMLSGRMVEDAHRAGYPVLTATINDAPTLKKFIGWGTDVILTDEPVLALRLAGIEPKDDLAKEDTDDDGD